MTIGSDVGPSRRSKNRQTSGAQQAQWQFQSDLLDQLSDAVIAVDLDECITYLNRAAVAQYRVDPVSALGQPLSHAYRYEWLQPEDELLADAALAQQGHWRGENRHIRRDGSTLHVESQVTILRDGAGNATGLLATIRDITDRKQMERDLRASELRYRRLADTLPQLVWSADVVGVTDYYNIHIHDFDPSVWQGAKGFDWESLLHPDDLAPTLAIWQEAVTQRRPYSCEHRMRMADGSWRWHLSRAVLLQDPDSGLRWYGTATDIHERKTTEEALRTSQRLMQAIVNISPTVIYIHDLITSQNVFVSPQAATTLGYTAAEFAAFGAELMQTLMHPDDQIAIGGHFDRLLTAPDSAVFEFEYRMRHKEGYWSWFLTRDLVFQRTPDGRPAQVLGVAVEITERKAAEDMLRASQERLQLGIQVAGLVLAEVDYTTNLIHLDSAAATLYGLPADVGAVPRATVHAAFHPDDAPEIFRRMQAAFDPTGPGWFVMDHRVVHPDGAIRWLYVRKQVFFATAADGTRHPVRALLAAFDITEQKAAEEQLAFHANLLNYAYDGVIATDADLNITAWNRGAEEAYGWRAAEVLGRKPYEVLQSSMTPAARAEAVRHLAENGRFRVEVTLHQRNGTAIIVEGQTAALRNAAGQITGYITVNRDIRERKAAEAALRASEERYRTLFETMEEGFCVFEMLYDKVGQPIDYRFLEVNPAFARFTGLENAVGKTAYELVPNLEAHWVAIYGAVARTGEAHHFIEGSAAMGRWFEVYAFRFGGPESRRVALLFTNITERKMIEEALRAREAQLRQLADAMPQIVWQGDEAGGVVYLNQRWYDYTGLTVEQSLADPTQATHPDDQAMAMRVWQEVRPQGKPYEYELRLRRADGIYRWHLTRCVPVYSPKGQLLCWYGTSTDLHDRKEAEIALRTSEERLRLATEAGSVGIFDYDSLTNRSEASSIYARIVGLPPEEAAERSRWLTLLHPEDRPMVEAIWAEAFKGRTSYYYECRLIRPDGVLRWIEVNAWVTTNAAGQGIRITGAIRDITERKQPALHQQFLLSLNSTLRTLTDADAIQQTVVEQVGEYLGVDRCRFNAIDLAADKATLLAAWSRPGLPLPSDIMRLSDHAPAAYIASAKAGHTLVVHDVAQDEGNESTKTLLQNRGYAATIRVPCLREGEWIASLHVLQTTPRHWRADEVQLVENVVHHFWPLAEKARAEAELRRQEEFLRQLADNVPGLVGYLGADERYRFVNATFEEWFQRPRRQIIGHSVAELIGEEDHHHLTAYRQQALAGEKVSYEIDFAYPDGVMRTVWGRYQPDVAADGRVRGFYLFLMDITERKQAEVDARFLADLAETIRLAQDEKTLIADAVTLVGEHLHLGRSLWIEVEPAQDRGVVRYQHCRDQAPIAAEFRLSAYSDATKAAMDAGLPLVIHDTATDPRTADRNATLYAPRGVGALVNVPFLHAGEWRSLLAATVAAPRHWQAREVRLLETVAERIWLALEKLRAEQALRASEARFRAVQQATPDGYMIFESVRDAQGMITDFRWLYLNPASEQMVGRPTADLLGKCLLVEMPGNRETGLFDAYVHVVETGEVYQREFCYQHDGIDRWFRNTAAKAGDGFAVAFSDITARKQAEVDQQLLAELAEQIRVADDADELVAATVRLLGDHLQVGRCLWIEIYGAHQRGAIRAQHCRGLPPVTEAYDQADYSPATLGELAAGRVLVNHDAQQDPRTAALYETLYVPYQERAYVGVPFLREGVWRGILSVTTPAPRQWQAREISLLETVAERVWLAVDKLRLVAELRTNEARYRTIFEHAGVSLWEEDFSRVKGGVDELTAAWRAAGVTDLAAAMRSHCAAHPDFVLAMLDRVRILNVNEETVRLYGRPKAELLRPFAHHFDAETVTRFVDQLALIASGQQRYRFDGPITTPQGETRHIAFTVVFPADADGDFTRVLLSGLDVTPLKAAEVENQRLFLETQSLLAQVQEGERFLQSIADTIPNVIYLFDLRTMRNRYTNRHLAVTLGYTAAEAQALGDQFTAALLHPDDQRYLADHLTHLNALADGEMADWEYRMQHKGGEWRWFSSREIVFERDEQGRPAVILGALQDSTARKEAEVALRASEASFRHLAEAMPQVVWTSATDGTTTYINQQWVSYSGMSLAETLAQGMWPAIHPADQATNREEWRRALMSGTAYEGEVRYRQHDGAYRWFLERAIPVQDEAGAIQQWFGVSMEIHDRKEAEQRQAELVALLEALLANAPVGFAFLDREQRFVRINKMLAEQHGRAIADHIGHPFAELAPHAAKSVGPILEQVFVTGVGIYNREISGPKVANPNEIIHALASWFPVVVNGVTQYVGSMMVDITERKRQERHQQFLSKLGLDLRLLSDTAAILAQVVNRLSDYLQVAGCRINEVDQQRAQFTLLKDWVAADAPWPIAATPGVYPLTELAPPALLAALQAGQTVAVANTLTDPQTAPVASNYENDQVHSLIGVPIFHQGEWRATLSVKGYGERHWRPDEVTLVEAVASQLSALLEKVRAEEALRASEERLRLALAGGGMGIWESQLAANRSLWSAEEYALFGLAPDVEITNALFNRLVHPDDLPGLQAALTHLIAAGSDRTGEFRIIRPDGAVRWLADRVTVIRDESGQAVRLLGINFDITERKEREAMIRQQLAEIEAIYATAPIGLCLVDCDLRYVRINETLATINGSTIPDQLGRTLAETQPAEGYQLVEPLYRGVIETGIPLLNREVHESYVDPAQARDWLASYYPLKNAEGVVTGVNAVILEITERKRQERQLQELNASLEERVLERTKALAQANHALSITNRELEQFTYAAAHDLRTPLRGIANLVQWISEDAAPVLSPESQRHLDKLGGRVKRLEKMLEDMLAYSRVGRVRYQPETVDVQQLVQSLLDLLAPPFGFVLKAVGQLPTFAALRIPLELVFRNLLSNAIRHHHAPASGQVVVTVRDLDGWYEFCISDNGPGIDPQYHERIFGMFQTLKPRDQVEGSGIGLALVKKTVESMGGQIRMESALGEGTAFYFTWPKG
jgi:PAS domain S-box-containing protein